MSTIPNSHGDLRHAIEAIVRETPDFSLGTGTTGYSLPDDTEISGAGSVAALRTPTLEAIQALRGVIAELETKGILSPRGRPS